jgi:hypothetical protein
MEIIRRVEEMVQPYFEFNDFYKDADVMGHRNMDIEDMPKLFFKLISHKPRPLIGQRQQAEIVEKLKLLDIGTVTIDTIPNYGRYIIIEVKKGS